ncbi:hypothetical protein B6E66_14490 [Streptomyces maremycinicus]|nr:hypothetical protein B6E66_14490 [Streptomyces sp. B9173]
MHGDELVAEPEGLVEGQAVAVEGGAQIGAAAEQGPQEQGAVDRAADAPGGGGRVVRRAAGDRCGVRLGARSGVRCGARFGARCGVRCGAQVVPQRPGGGGQPCGQPVGVSARRVAGEAAGQVQEFEGGAGVDGDRVAGVAARGQESAHAEQRSQPAGALGGTGGAGAGAVAGGLLLLREKGAQALFGEGEHAGAGLLDRAGLSKGHGNARHGGLLRWVCADGTGRGPGGVRAGCGAVRCLGWRARRAQSYKDRGAAGGRGRSPLPADRCGALRGLRALRALRALRVLRLQRANGAFAARAGGRVGGALVSVGRSRARRVARSTGPVPGRKRRGAAVARRAMAPRPAGSAGAQG